MLPESQKSIFGGCHTNFYPIIFSPQFSHLLYVNNDLRFFMLSFIIRKDVAYFRTCAYFLGWLIRHWITFDLSAHFMLIFLEVHAFKNEAMNKIQEFLDNFPTYLKKNIIFLMFLQKLDWNNFLRLQVLMDFNRRKFYLEQCSTKKIILKISQSYLYNKILCALEIFWNESAGGGKKRFFKTD